MRSPTLCRPNGPSHRASVERRLFYLSLSTRGTGDGLWRFHNGEAFEVTKGADNVLSEPPVVSPDGNRVAIVVRQHGKRQLAIMSADGTNSRTLAPSIEIHGVVGQGAADWSPDGSWIVAAGSDATAPGLFRIPVDGGAPVRLVRGMGVQSGLFAERRHDHLCQRLRRRRRRVGAASHTTGRHTSRPCRTSASA